jgi:uncharacterized repeat protein (TIGR03803 family)
MNSAATNRVTNGPSIISSITCNVSPRFASAKLSAAAIRGALTLVAVSALLLIATLPAHTQTETILYSFCSQGSNCTDGAFPQSSLTSDGKGNFYGTTYLGGAYFAGTVFELSPNGSGGWNETVLYSFTGGVDGAFPAYSPVIFDSLGNLYGTAYTAGANGAGVVFELSPVGKDWQETVLYNFCSQAGCTDGAAPVGGLIMDRAGNLYGTTISGPGSGAIGTVFELSPSGSGWKEQVIYNVAASYAGLTMDPTGNIFGVGSSKVFELSPNGKGGWTTSVLHTFIGTPTDGSAPEGTLVLDKAGNLYGTTTTGGASNLGTVYKMTHGKKGWTERILHSFTGAKHGSDPWAGVVLDAAGNLFGTTIKGGNLPGIGIIFELVAPIGKSSYYKENVLWSFTQVEGYAPYGSLIRDSAGNLYGTTYQPAGGVFELTP